MVDKELEYAPPVKSSGRIRHNTLKALEDASYKEGTVLKKKRTQRTPERSFMIPNSNEDVLESFDMVPTQYYNKLAVTTASQTLTPAKDTGKHEDLVRRLFCD